MAAAVADRYSGDAETRVARYAERVVDSQRAAGDGRNNAAHAAVFSLGKFAAREGFDDDVMSQALADVTATARAAGLPASEWADRDTRRSYDAGRRAG